jgi:hypothetical protein
MLTTDADVYAIVGPTALDVHRLGQHARDTGRAIVAHPDTLAEMHAAAVIFGPVINRVPLAAVLDVRVVADEDVPGPLVLLVPSV